MTKEEIHNICSKYKITNYTINDDLSIDVDGDVNLCNKNLNNGLPLKFRNVTGYFDCCNSNLISLNGAPSSVGGNFDCSWNKLKTLEGAPSLVGRYFNCFSNSLTNLIGIPLNINQEILYLPNRYTYMDYLNYCKSYDRDNKFKKLLKCQ